MGRRCAAPATNHGENLACLPLDGLNSTVRAGAAPFLGLFCRLLYDSHAALVLLPPTESDSRACTPEVASQTRVGSASEAPTPSVVNERRSSAGDVHEVMSSHGSHGASIDVVAGDRKHAAEASAAVTPQLGAEETDSVAALTAQVARLEEELRRSNKLNDTLETRLKSLLWEYIPKQRSTGEIPPVDPNIVSYEEDGGLSLRDYTFERFIGSGHFGDVHTAFRCGTGDRCAIKVLNITRQLRLEDLLALEQEIRALKVLCHPNIIRLHEVVHGKNHVCVVMDYMAGGTLYALIDFHGRAGVPLEDAQRILASITSAVAYMHYRGFSHRDLKPENVLMDSSSADAQPVLIDMGLSTKSKPGQAVKSSCGTNGFMAPELHMNRSSIPSCADTWALGCMLVELLCGNNSINVLRDITEQTYGVKMESLRVAMKSSIGGVPPDALDLVNKLMCLEPKARPVAGKVLDHPFLAAASPCNSSLSEGFMGSPMGSRKSVAARSSLSQMDLRDVMRDATTDLSSTLSVSPVTAGISRHNSFSGSLDGGQPRSGRARSNSSTDSGYGRSPSLAGLQRNKQRRSTRQPLPSIS